MTIYGYMRVSTRDQNEGRQLAALAQYGVPVDKIYCDKQSGKDFDREQYQRLVRKRLRKGDVLVVKSIDRLGRNYSEILEQWRIITKVIRADIVILDMPILDTHRDRDLTGTLIADVVLQLLSYVAENERENILRRQMEGIALAKANGVKFGRPTVSVSPDFISVYERYRCNDITLDQALRETGFSKSTFYRWEKKFLLTQGSPQHGHPCGQAEKGLKN